MKTLSNWTKGVCTILQDGAYETGLYNTQGLSTPSMPPPRRKPTNEDSRDSPGLTRRPPLCRFHRNTKTC